LNQGTIREEAKGFRIDTLFAIMSTKGKAPNYINVFTYVMQKIYNDKKEILEFVERFEIFNDVAGLNVDDLMTDLGNLKNSLGDVKKGLEFARNSVPIDYGFANCFGEFFTGANKSINRAEEIAKTYKNVYSGTVISFGEDSKANSAKFFTQLKELTAMIQSWMKREDEKQRFDARKKALGLK